ncbi:helix-turn-helix protein [Saccharothrix variisporea]|uniref:Helix-turn-helix protein n=1 Tax=Saccharothrix variisporea TaxID=543527 RepID=A0A495X695_9PSEU|nr:helix-turn-helix protein [Saccharothrix variisporea]
MRTNNIRRSELGRFLRSRRERCNPAESGFPRGPRRRSQGLRREEVAMLAGVSPTWYTYLEQGRDIRPSPEVVDSLARVLCLSEDERRYVHTLAFGHVVRPQPLDGELSGAELLKRLVAAAEDDPYPVLAVGSHGDLLGWNRAATDWYDDWDVLPEEERNLVRWLLTAPAARERLVDWADEARDAVAVWRAESARCPDVLEVDRRVRELGRVSAEFRLWWDEQTVRERRSRTRRFRHPEEGVRELRLVPLESPEFAPAVVLAHLPA